MKHCRNCGNPLKEGARFCPKCGKPVQEPLPSADQARKKAQKPAAEQQNQQKESPKKTGKGPRIVWMILLVLVVMGTAAFAGYRLVNGIISSDDPSGAGQDKDEETERDEETQEGEAEKESASSESDQAETDAKPLEETSTDSAATVAEPTTEAAKETGIHRYQLVTEDCTWNEAYDRAKAAGGYLVHINDQEEYDYLLNYLLNTEEARELKIWIGGARSADSREYHWANEDGTFGDEILNSADYSACWMKNEPSFRDDSIGQDEYYMNLFYYTKEGRWVWNDVPNDLIAAVSSYQGNIAYIVEFD